MFKIYACYTDNHQLAGVAIPASGQGFQDVIRILYGYVPEKNAVVGMQVLESTETPGLGDKIEKDEDFLVNFKGLDVRLAKNQDRLLHPIKLVKAGQKTEPWQISAITGATISSRAIAKMIRESAEKNLPLIKDNLSNLQ
ncbi:MAG: FMN-binding protein, partial [candidate division Zixibacteria bacterium]|nr:FMN-binding protein [candidate division Zixibacteria bacterium]